MALNPYTALNFPDQQLNRLQDNIRVALQPVIASPVVGGFLFSAIPLVAGMPYTLQHNLGKTPVICLVALQDANSVVWQSNLGTTSLILNASANVNVSVWVA